MNPLIRLVITSPLGRRVSSLGLITFYGRKSGREIRTPVAFHELDGVPYVFTDRGWRCNFTGGAAVTVIRCGRRWEGRATLLEVSSYEVGSMIRRALDNKSPRALGLRIERGHDPSVEELAALGQSAIRLDLE